MTAEQATWHGARWQLTTARPQNDPDIPVQVHPGRTWGGHSGRSNWHRVMPSYSHTPLHRGQRNPPRPVLPELFQKSLTKPWFIDRNLTIFTCIGVAQDQFCGHSYRIGAATTTAMTGVEDSVLQILDQWHR